jgi:hypothetical protein
MKIAGPKPVLSKAVLQSIDLQGAKKGQSRPLSVHAFEWSERTETARCSCGQWAEWGQWPGTLTRESAKRSHEDHRSNRLAASAKDETEATADAV